jgi:hypothetical protein
MREVVQHKLAVDAVLLYEQWGWPMPTTAWERVAEEFPDTPLIWDRVDSTDFLSRTNLPSPLIAAEISSLSKMLGLPGGGLLRCREQYIQYQSEPLSHLTQQLMQSTESLADSFEYKEYLKNHKQFVHPNVLSWVRENSLSTALQDECAIRRLNFRKLQESRCTETWEPWMKIAVEEGSTAANIAPLLRGKSRVEVQKAVEWLQEGHRVFATEYHFNWSGDPLSPKYEPCLALPVHGLMTKLDDILADLKNNC